MGVPKLFKYLTERYPSLCQTVAANQVHFFTVFLRITQLMVFFLFILSVAKIRLFLYRSEFPSAQSGERTKWTAIGKGG